MSTCSDCVFFNRLPEDAIDFAPGRGDCVTENKDQKGKFWLAKPVNTGDAACPDYSTK